MKNNNWPFWLFCAILAILCYFGHFGIFWSFRAVLAVLGCFGHFGPFWSGQVWSELNCFELFKSYDEMGLDGWMDGSNLDI